jgi:hypothetical protein
MGVTARAIPQERRVKRVANVLGNIHALLMTGSPPDTI